MAPINAKKHLSGTSLITTAFVTLIVGTVLFVLFTMLAGTSIIKLERSAQAAAEAAPAQQQ